MADKQTKVNMVSSQSWRDHFKVDQSVLEAFWEDFSQNSPMRASEMSPSEAGNSIEFILWCIQQGHFTEEAFVQWQSEAFEIPVVRQAYFEAPVDAIFWDRVKEIHPWSATCMPLTEWDDVLLVAVANPSAQNLTLSTRHRVVLAAPSRLREYFERVDQATASKPIIFTPPQETAPSATAEPAVSEPVAVESAAPAAHAETPPVPQPFAPAAVDDSGDPFAALSRELGLLNNQESETNESHEALADAPTSEAPEGLVLPDGFIMPEEFATATPTEAPSEVRSEPADDSVNFDLNGSSLAGSSEAPEGFSIPSPAMAAQPEESENSASDGGTLVHNFETGKDEVVAKTKTTDEPSVQPKPVAPPPLNLNIDTDPVATAADTPVTPPFEISASEKPAPETAALETPSEQPPAANVLDSDDPLASLVMAASDAMNQVPSEAQNASAAPKSTGKNAGIPDLPFSIPRHETEAASQSPTEAGTETPAEPVAAPVTEAVAAPAAEQAPKTGRIRKPLFAPVDDAATQPAAKTSSKTGTSSTGTPSAFEPRSSKGAGFEATQAVSIQNNGAQGDSDQDTKIGGKTGTFAGTQTRARRLENTPVTSMLGANERGVHQERPEPPGGNPTYLNKSIAIGKLDPIHLDQCRSIDEAGAQAILQACNIYECAMILLFRGGDLVPWKWNDLFLSVRGDKPEPIDLVEPSIFKVVFRTAKPYHGYLVTSEVNQKFFNEFYRGMLPKHATITPLMIDGRMGGMVLGFTNSKVDYRQSLRLMERLTFDLARVFKTLRGTMAKAG